MPRAAVRTGAPVTGAHVRHTEKAIYVKQKYNVYDLTVKETICGRHQTCDAGRGDRTGGEPGRGRPEIGTESPPRTLKKERKKRAAGR